MALTRRKLLAGGAAAAAGAALAGCGDRDANGTGATTATGARGRGAGAAQAPEDLSTWAGVRRELPLDPRIRSFSAFLLAPHPRPVRAAIEHHRALLDLDPEGYLRSGEGRADPAGAAARYLCGGRDDIALTTSTTMSLAILYRALRLRPGEEILSTVHDHFATDESLRLAGGRVRRVRLYGPRDPATASTDEIASRLHAAIRPRTRAVAITWVHSSTGVKLPMDEIGRVVREAGERRGRKVLLCVDGVHALGAEDVRISDPTHPGIDFFAAGCHKWLMGPRGTGLVWATPAAWQRVTPVIPTFASAQAPGPLHTPGGFHSFEHRWALAQAFGFQRAVGPARIQARVRTLAARLRRGLAGLGGVRVITPPGALMAALVMVDLANAPAEQVVAELRSAGIATSVPPYEQRYVRFGTQVTLSGADVDAAVRAVRRLA